MKRTYPSTFRLEVLMALWTAFYALAWVVTLVLEVMLFPPVLLIMFLNWAVVDTLDSRLGLLNYRAWRWLTVGVPFHYFGREIHP